MPNKNKLIDSNTISLAANRLAKLEASAYNQTQSPDGYTDGYWNALIDLMHVLGIPCDKHRTYPLHIATNIKWDTDGEPVDLPTEIILPEDVSDPDEATDYLSDLTGFCHCGFDIETIE